MGCEKFYPTSLPILVARRAILLMEFFDEANFWENTIVQTMKKGTREWSTEGYIVWSITTVTTPQVYGL